MELKVLIDELVAAAPDLAPLLAEHEHDYGERLPYLFLMDIAELAGRLQAGGEEQQAQLAAILATMEAAWASPDGDRMNFAASFVETLAAFDLLPVLRPRLGLVLGKIADREYLPGPPFTWRQRGAMLLHRMFPGFPKGA